MPRHVREDDEESDRSRPVEPELVLIGRAFLHRRLEPVEVGISDDGTIVRLGRNVRGSERIDLGEKVILPAATDLHVHLRDPGGPAASDSFPTGTVQAALGGVTLVGEMPNTHPTVSDPDAAEDKARRARGRVAVDVLLYGAALDPRQVTSLARHVGGFKLYLGPTTGMPEPPGIDGLGALLEAVARTGLPLAVHAEDPRRFRDGPPPADPIGWGRHRPLAAEEDAVAAVVDQAPAHLRLHVAHVTSPAIAERLRSAGHSFEVTPHHLLLNERTFRDARGKVNPPLRPEEERAALLADFDQGRVPCLASDHAPHARDEKERAFALAPSGVPGVETLLPLFLARVREGAVPLSTLIAAACDRPARWLGLPFGRLSVGHQARLIAVDFRAVRRLAADRLHAPCGWTPFEGRPAVFPSDHFRGTRRVVEGGEFVGKWEGEIVRPEFADRLP